MKPVNRPFHPSHLIVMSYLSRIFSLEQSIFCSLMSSFLVLFIKQCYACSVFGLVFKRSIFLWYHFKIYLCTFILKTFYLFIFRERRKGEKHQCVIASQVPPTGDLAHNPGIRPDWESNQRHFGSQAGTQSTEPHQPELYFHFNMTRCILWFSYSKR